MSSETQTTVDPNAVDPGLVDVVRALIAQEMPKCPTWIDWSSVVLGVGIGMAATALAIAAIFIAIGKDEE